MDAISSVSTSFATAPLVPTGPESLEIPPYLQSQVGLDTGGFNQLLDTVLPTLDSTTSPVEILGAQMSIMEAQLGWIYTSQVAGKLSSGVQTLFNNQV